MLLARSRALAVCACAALAAGVAGCTTAATTTSISGGTLKIFVSKSPGPLGGEEQDVFLAEELALSQSGNHVGKYTVKLVQASGNELSDNARAAISDPETIAYVGELQPGTSGQTIGITNGEDILQVSPTDTAVELTQSSPAVPGSPDNFYESLGSNGRTFARVVPTTKLEAGALLGEMQTLGVKHLYVPTDGSQYGLALRSVVASDAASHGVTIASTSAGADGVLFAGNSAAEGARVLSQAAGPSVKLFAPSALAEASFAAALSPAAQDETYVSSPGFTRFTLPPLGSDFESAFRIAYGHAPGPDAVFGYEAVKAILTALDKAGSSAGNRSTVVHDFFGIRNRRSAIGTYSIDKNGDISFVGAAPFVINRIENGNLVPFRAVPQPG
jgi:ABC-type branched-subunit amino acid transport system substrate-binding protein